MRQRASLRNKPGTRPAQQKFQPSSLLPPIPAEQSPSPSTSPAPTPPKQRKGKPQEVQVPATAPLRPQEDMESPKRSSRPQQESHKKPAKPPQEEVLSPRRPARPQERDRPTGKEPRPHPKITGPSVSVPAVNVPIRDDSEDSPEIVSDSDPEENYLNFTFQQINIEKMKKKRRGSGSESSMASSLSEENTPVHAAKRPVATPRRATYTSHNTKPPLPPKPEEIRPPLPPRPAEIPKIRKHKSMNEIADREAEPERPRQRPRKSEIKRAKNRARAAKNTPTLTVVDEDGLETMSNITSTTSGHSYKSTKSAPPGAGVRDPQKKRRSQTTHSDPDSTPVSTASTTGPLLAAPKQRPRGRSVPQEPDEAPPTVTPMGSLDESLLGGGCSKSMTETLLKMIMSSDDPALKAALRDLITSGDS